jgi:6-phosphogluconate dehydrogenase
MAKLKIGFIGLGRMGLNMVYNLLDHGYKPVVLNRSLEPTRQAAKKGAIPAFSISELINKLPKQKIVWLMIPAGKPVDKTISNLLPYLKRGDIVIDGGNSYYLDSQKRYKQLKKKGISYIDCGTSGGQEGARKGACMMIGGDKKVYKKTESLYRDMTVKDGYGYMGTSGGGHFVKMIHNGIEYGMMGAIAEGLQTIDNYKKEFGTELGEAIKVYSHGSIISSSLMGWLENAWKQDNYLKKIQGKVPKGETEDEMNLLERHKKANMKILTQARLMRVKSRTKPSMAGKILASMRNQFGGHKVKKK